MKPWLASPFRISPRPRPPGCRVTAFQGSCAIVRLTALNRFQTPSGHCCAEWWIQASLGLGLKGAEPKLTWLTVQTTSTKEGKQFKCQWTAAFFKRDWLPRSSSQAAGSLVPLTSTAFLSLGLSVDGAVDSMILNTFSVWLSFYISSQLSRKFSLENRKSKQCEEILKKAKWFIHGFKLNLWY